MLWMGPADLCAPVLESRDALGIQVIGCVYRQRRGREDGAVAFQAVAAQRPREGPGAVRPGRLAVARC